MSLVKQEGNKKVCTFISKYPKGNKLGLHPKLILQIFAKHHLNSWAWFLISSSFELVSNLCSYIFVFLHTQGEPWVCSKIYFTYNNPIFQTCVLSATQNVFQVNVICMYNRIFPLWAYSEICEICLKVFYTSLCGDTFCHETISWRHQYLLRKYTP